VIALDEESRVSNKSDIELWTLPKIWASAKGKKHSQQECGTKSQKLILSNKI